ncbi:MAG: hypothetical protein ABGX16_16435 [Pirellulales bacterium]
MPSHSYQLTVNAYDRTATLLVALLVIVSIAVLGLVIVFFASTIVVTIEPIPVVPVEAISSSANQGLALDPEPPGVEEAPDLAEPQLQDTLDAMMSLTSLRQTLLSDEEIDADKQLMKGQGLGDSRLAGPDGEGVVERVPRWQRWRFRFEPRSVADYASWLDFYKIEIGVLGRDNQVHYAGQWSGGNPTTREGNPNQETRGYAAPADGPMPGLTMQLARQAKIASQGSILLLFYPFEVESILWVMEKKYAGDRDVNTIRQTIFTVKRSDDRYEFEVVSQKYF